MKNSKRWISLTTPTLASPQSPRRNRSTPLHCPHPPQLKVWIRHWHDHREHTLLLSRKRANKGMKRTNSLPLSLVVLTGPYCRENRYLQVLRSTAALNSYLGFPALCKLFLLYVYIKQKQFCRAREALFLFIPLFALFLFNKSVCSLWHDH